MTDGGNDTVLFAGKGSSGKSGGLLLTVTGMDAGDKVNGANKTDAGVSTAFDIIKDASSGTVLTAANAVNGLKAFGITGVSNLDAKGNGVFVDSSSSTSYVFAKFDDSDGIYTAWGASAPSGDGSDALTGIVLVQLNGVTNATINGNGEIVCG